MVQVSVIIPCFNCQDLIGETFQSLQEQTRKDFEVICVNDGSCDGTLHVLHYWKNQGIFNMQVIDKPNGGVSSARNEGIRAAKGKYILFLDADDMLHPSCIQLLCEAIEESNVDVSYGWLSRDKRIIDVKSKEIAFVRQSQNEAMHNLLYFMPKLGFTCFLYRKEWLLQYKIAFDMHTKRFEDREFNWKYLSHCETAVLVDAPLYYYRVCQNSATKSKQVTWSTERLDAVRRVEAYMEQRQCAFLPELKNYLFPRVMWSVVKEYAVAQEKDLIERLGREYDVRSCMKRTARDNNKLVALASCLYLIHPMLFYYIVRLKK